MALRNSSKKASKGTDEPLGAQVSSRLYKKDNKPFFAVAKSDFKGNESLATRELISEALTARRLKSIGRDTSLAAVKEAQHEVVVGETDEIKTMLRDLLAIARGSGTNIDRVVSQNREIYGVIFHVLRKVLNIEDLAHLFIARPALEAEGKDEGEITESLTESEETWTTHAQTILESVRTQLSQAGT